MESRIIQKEIDQEMKKSYLDYAMSVLVSRALPDVRDGLKPVHRRVLYTMYVSSLFHNKPFRKSANVVGNCMAKYHPHGDSAIYDTLVRLAQPFALRNPLIEGQGNFGSIDGDNAAAMRYTECRLAELAESLLDDLDKDTVIFTPNFDGSTNEPAVLPAKYPNLLVNGSSGIAVGMATNIPPHNLKEAINASLIILDNPNAELMAILKVMPGPDFPTGAQICGKAGIIEAYNTGSGSITVRAKIIEEKDSLIITEIPYQLNKTQLIEQIVECVRDKIIVGIKDIRDESDKSGIRLILELKKEADPQVIKASLYAKTRLESTIGIMLICLVDSKPKTVTLLQLLSNFILHRKDVVIKRTQYQLRKAQEKYHLLEGLVIALNNIDAVIAKIKKSKTADEAKKMLISDYKLSELQAAHILELRLQRLAALEQEKIRAEEKETLLIIEELNKILASEDLIKEIIRKELNEISEKFGDNRRSEFIDFDDKMPLDFIKQEDVVVTLSHAGYIKRISQDAYKSQKRGGKGVVAQETKESDFIQKIFIANTHSYLLVFTSKGQVHWLKVYEIPEGNRYGIGKAIVNLVKLSQNEKVTAILTVSDFPEDKFLVMATKLGTIKKTPLSQFGNPRSGGIIAILLENDDELRHVKITDGNEILMMATARGRALRFNEKDIRPSGRSAKGVRGIRLKKEDSVISLVSIVSSETILTITSSGFGKRSNQDEYREVSRGGSGVINIKGTKKNGKVINVESVKEDSEILMVSKNGQLIRIMAKDIPLIGRHTQGVRVMRLDANDEVVSFAKV